MKKKVRKQLKKHLLEQLELLKKDSEVAESGKLANLSYAMCYLAKMIEHFDK